MEKKRTYVTIIIMISLALVISLVGWVKTRADLINLRQSDYGQYQKSLDVCEDIGTPEKLEVCTQRLTDFSKALDRYEGIIKEVAAEIRKQNRPATPPSQSTTTAPKMNIKIVSTTPATTGQ